MIRIRLASAMLCLLPTSSPPATVQHIPKLTSSDSCDVQSLGRALAVDTTRLRRVTREGLSTGSLEGTTLTVYSDRTRPRVVVTTDFGETSRTLTTYYLLTPGDFVAEREEIYYQRSLGAGTPQTRSRVKRILYFCQGKPLSVDQDTLGMELKARHDSIASALMPRPQRNKK